MFLTMRDYKKLLAAWEEVADAADFEAARSSAEDFITVDELRRQVSRQNEADAPAEDRQTRQLSVTERRDTCFQ